VGRELGRLMDKPVIGIHDNWLEPRWQTSVASKLAEVGDHGFVAAEARELLAFDHENHIVSLTGSNPLHFQSMEHLCRTGIIVYWILNVKQFSIDACRSYCWSPYL
jgi:shikimate kinase